MLPPQKKTPSPDHYHLNTDLGASTFCGKLANGEISEAAYSTQKVTDTPPNLMESPSDNGDKIIGGIEPKTTDELSGLPPGFESVTPIGKWASSEKKIIRPNFRARRNKIPKPLWLFPELLISLKQRGYNPSGRLFKRKGWKSHPNYQKPHPEYPELGTIKENKGLYRGGLAKTLIKMYGSTVFLHPILLAAVFTLRAISWHRAGYSGVSVIGFRGDARSPDQIKQLGGFIPWNVHESDKFETQPANKKLQSFLYSTKKLFKQFYNLTLYGKGSNINLRFRPGSRRRDSSLVSFSTDINIAKGFPLRKKKEQPETYLYVTKVIGGIKPNQLDVESEVAAVNTIPFEQVVAWRKVKDGLFTGPVVVRNDFSEESSELCQEIVELLSGKPQETVRPKELQHFEFLI